MRYTYLNDRGGPCCPQRVLSVLRSSRSTCMRSAKERRSAYPQQIPTVAASVSKWISEPPLAYARGYGNDRDQITIDVKLGGWNFLPR